METFAMTASYTSSRSARCAGSAAWRAASKAKVVTYCEKCDRSVCIDHFEEYHTKS
jgi:hypothetical protein